MTRWKSWGVFFIIDDIKAVEAMLQAMGNRHIIYGVQAAHYETVGAALFWVLEQSLGDYFNNEVEEAWVTEIMF
jgi:hemoglobin-like flavoprotein